MALIYELASIFLYPFLLAGTAEASSLQDNSSVLNSKNYHSLQVERRSYDKHLFDKVFSSVKNQAKVLVSRDSSFNFLYCWPCMTPRKFGMCSASSYYMHLDYNSIVARYFYKSNTSDDLEIMPLPKYVLYLPPYGAHSDFNESPFAEYYARYKKRSLGSTYKAAPSDDRKFDGLTRYKSSEAGQPWFWVSNEIGNIGLLRNEPFIVFCTVYYCSLDVDYGDGWIIEYDFNEGVLNDWRTLYKKIDTFDIWS